MVASARLRGLWEDLRAPILVFLAVRVFLSLAVYLGSPFLPPSPRGMPWQAFPGQPLLDVWLRWDSGWYASIAQAGYRYLADQPSNMAFFPLYPLAIKAVTFATGNLWISGLLISNLAFLAALVVLFKLVRLKFDGAVAERTVLYVAVFPSAFFFYAMYSESLYLLAVVSAFYLWERGRGRPAGVLGAVAALTRPMGILLFLAGVAHHLGERGLRPLPLLAGKGLSLLLIPLALGGFLAYSYAAFGEPLAFLSSRVVGWDEPLSLLPLSHRQLAASILSGGFLSGQGPTLRLYDAAAGITFLALTIPVFRRLGPAYGLYTLGSLAMPLLVTLDGLSRYVSVIFPVFMIVASWRARRPLIALLASLSLGLMGLLASMFANWYFVG